MPAEEPLREDLRTLQLRTSPVGTKNRYATLAEHIGKASNQRRLRPHHYEIDFASCGQRRDLVHRRRCHRNTFTDGVDTGVSRRRKDLVTIAT
jgi:hypothetical protein